MSVLKSELQSPTFNARRTEQLASDSESLVRKVTNDTHSLLARAEEDLALEIVTRSMSSLAYKVKTSGMALTATKGCVSVHAKIEAGRIQLDTTSFPGISCHAETRKIEEDLERRGLVLRRLCENRMNLRRPAVRLKDPFPNFPLRESNNGSYQNQRIKGIESQIKSAKHMERTNNHTNFLIQQGRQQRNRNRIKEKMT